jgi:hypothetical protein
MAAFHAVFSAPAAADYIDELAGRQPAWVRDDNISVYDLITPDRLVRQNYSISENNLASPEPRRFVLGVVGGNEVSKLGGNPQDIESDLSWRTRPLTKCPGREYHPSAPGATEIKYNNRKTDLRINIQPIHLKEAQPWAYPVTYGPLPLKKETCGRPEKY